MAFTDSPVFQQTSDSEVRIGGPAPAVPSSIEPCGSKDCDHRGLHGCSDW